MPRSSDQRWVGTHTLLRHEAPSISVARHAVSQHLCARCGSAPRRHASNCRAQVYSCRRSVQSTNEDLGGCYGTSTTRRTLKHSSDNAHPPVFWCTSRRQLAVAGQACASQTWQVSALHCMLAASAGVAAKYRAPCGGRRCSCDSSTPELMQRISHWHLMWSRVVCVCCSCVEEDSS